jgi:hypothetical protein
MQLDPAPPGTAFNHHVLVTGDCVVTLEFRCPQTFGVSEDFLLWGCLRLAHESRSMSADVQIDCDVFISGLRVVCCRHRAFGSLVLTQIVCSEVFLGIGRYWTDSRQNRSRIKVLRLIDAAAGSSSEGPATLRQELRGLGDDRDRARAVQKIPRCLWRSPVKHCCSIPAHRARALLQSSGINDSVECSASTIERSLERLTRSRLDS